MARQNGGALPLPWSSTTSTIMFDNSVAATHPDARNANAQQY